MVLLYNNFLNIVISDQIILSSENLNIQYMTTFGTMMQFTWTVCFLSFCKMHAGIGLSPQWQIKWTDSENEWIKRIKEMEFTEWTSICKKNLNRICGERFDQDQQKTIIAVLSQDVLCIVEECFSFICLFLLAPTGFIWEANKTTLSSHCMRMGWCER